MARRNELRGHTLRHTGKCKYGKNRVHDGSNRAKVHTHPVVPANLALDTRASRLRTTPGLRNRPYFPPREIIHSSW